MNPADPSSERLPAAGDTPTGPASGNTPPLALLSHARTTTNGSPAGAPSEKEKAPEGKERENFEPQYLDVPVQRKKSRGGKNLLWGVLIFLVALALLVQAIALLGARATLPLGTALLTLVALFVLSRSRVLRQRNGGFVALAVVSLLAAVIPLVEYGSNRLAAGDRGVATARVELPLLTEAFKMAAPDEKSARFKVLRDLRVVIDDKAHLIKEGEIFPVAETGNNEVRFTAGDQQIALPMNYVEMLQPATDTQSSGDELPQVVATPKAADSATPATADASAPDSAMLASADMSAADAAESLEPALPEDASPSQITQRAQREAIRRYPALGDKNSAENQLFIETYQELKFTGATDFFADPEWPLQLAELLAKRENWQRVP